MGGPAPNAGPPVIRDDPPHRALPARERWDVSTACLEEWDARAPVTARPGPTKCGNCGASVVAACLLRLSRSRCPEDGK
jgi:hypothetical protein